MLTALGMVLALSAAKWHCKPCASCKINPVPNFAALRHLWQYLIQQIDQLKARCSVAKLGPLRHKCHRIRNFLTLRPYHFFVLAAPEVVERVEQHCTINRAGNVSCQSKQPGFVPSLACTGNTELYCSFIGGCFILYLQWPGLPVYNLPAKQLKHGRALPEEDFRNHLAGTNSTAPSAHASSRASSSYRTREQNIAVTRLNLGFKRKIE